MLTLQIASSNRTKIEELQLGIRHWIAKSGPGLDCNVIPLPGIETIPPSPEDCGSFDGNAEQKALHYGRYRPGWVLADDSGLEVDALDGAPGVYSARYGGPDADDAANNRKLLQELDGIAPGDRSARFVCVLALVHNGRLRALFYGIADGEILESPVGSGGFGYDPLFWDGELQKSFAGLTPQQKLDRSHRGIAVRKLVNWIAGHRAEEALFTR